MPSAPIVVLGGGCAGLAAGIRLADQAIPVVIVEQANQVGGLAGGIHFDGNTYEYGPHIFHTTDAEIMSLIQSVAGPDLVLYRRTIKVKFLDQYFQFPLSIPDVLFKLPHRTVVRALFSFLYQSALGALRQPPEETSETVLRRSYGDVLYKIFFRDYIERVWGIPPADFSPSFARQRIPRLNLLETLDRMAKYLHLRSKASISDNYVEKVEGDLFTTRRGFSTIVERLARRFEDRGGRLLLGYRVAALHRMGRQIEAVTCQTGAGSVRLDCRAIVNTLPINDMVRMMEPALTGDDVREAAEALQFRALVFVGLVVSRTQVLPASLMYFRELTFNRISDLSYFGFEIKPPGSTLLIAEVTCNPKDRAWTDDAFIREQVVQELISEKLLTRSEIQQVHVFRAQHAYPIYKLHYERHLSILMRQIDHLANVETAGRQGRFQYVNSHVVLRMGFEAVERLLKKIDSEAKTTA